MKAVDVMWLRNFYQLVVHIVDYFKSVSSSFLA